MLRQFSSDGVDIAYIDVPPVAQDRAEPILLIHGFASNHRVNWVNPRWVDTLTRDGRRVVALDNRGHGASRKLYAPSDYRSDYGGLRGHDTHCVILPPGCGVHRDGRDEARPHGPAGQTGAQAAGRAGGLIWGIRIMSPCAP